MLLHDSFEIEDSTRDKLNFICNFIFTVGLSYYDLLNESNVFF